ncbi:aminopeptidase P family protein [Nakamurella silvestris]|nr:aminopeptidase P family protein [Nakamurella silvestris]
MSNHAAVDQFSARLAQLAVEVRAAAAAAAVITPGPDLSYLLGHSVDSHERLTCLVVPGTGTPVLVLPELERLGWSGSSAESLGLDIRTWIDGADPYAEVATVLSAVSALIAVGNHMPAVQALTLRAAVPGSELILAGPMIAELRMRKDADEIEYLALAGAAIDRVHNRMGEWLRAGRTEREVAADIAVGMVEEGHARPDFVIVGSGPNAASPHHDASDRVIQPGDAVVVDLGGPVPAGYFSDSTRTYQVAGEAHPELAAVHAVVRRAQAAAVAAVRPGATAESVDAAARRVVVDAGYGQYFITRTGHGIGLEVHEEPYIVAGNSRLLEPGMSFSIEPGIYLPGKFGVRIEDIVAVTEDGVRNLNQSSTALTVVG